MGLRNIFGQRAARWGLLLGMWVLATSAHSAPFEDSMAQRTLACTGCHGPQGRSGPDGYYPRLAGKPAGYLYNQMLNIQQGRRHYALMQNLLAPLDARYLREIAQYFSDLDIPYPPPVAQSRDPALLARGAQLARQGDAALNIPPCMQCHGQALTGVAPSVPGLLGLPRDYLNAQLGSWQTGLRQAQAPDCMAAIAKRLSDSDVHALSNWLASQPLPAQPRAANQRAPLPPGAKDIRCGSAPW
jgi:cytochrome c553